MWFRGLTVVVCLLGMFDITSASAPECEVIISGLDDKVVTPPNCAKGLFYWNYPHDKIDIDFRRFSLLPNSTNPITVCLRLLTGGRIDVTRTARKGRIVDLTPLKGDALSCYNQNKKRVTVTLDAGPDVVYYMHVIEYTAEELTAL